MLSKPLQWPAVSDFIFKAFASTTTSGTTTSTKHASQPTCLQWITDGCWLLWSHASSNQEPTIHIHHANIRHRPSSWKCQPPLVKVCQQWQQELTPWTSCMVAATDCPTPVSSVDFNKQHHPFIHHTPSIPLVDFDHECIHCEACYPLSDFTKPTSLD